MYMTRSDLWWRIGGVIVKDPTEAQLRSLRKGDCAFLSPPRTKPDQWGEIHCPFPSTFPYDDSPQNAAAALRDIELRCPCHGPDRETMPIIADKAGNPYTHAVLDGLLHSALVHRYGAAVASLYSWHSYRSGLASALFAAGCPDALIQLICRWMCPESLHIYRRLGTSQHADWVHKASQASVDSIQSGNVPTIDADQSYAEIFNDFNRSRRMFGDDWANALSSGFPPVDASRPTPASDSLPTDASRLTPAPPLTPTRPRPTPSPVPAAAPPAPLTKDNAVGRRVLVPASLYPQYACNEFSGTGWEGLALSATSVTIVVRFLHARTTDGRPYQDERLPLDTLLPL